MSMAIDQGERRQIRSSDDVIMARRLVRDAAIAAGLSLVEQTKLITAASELARNTLLHGGGGEMRLEKVSDGVRRGIKVTFVDEGPGIPNMDLAMKDGFSTCGGLGLGLSGSKRLVDQFDIDSKPGNGTTVSIVRWK
jgi:serine/threonine-protein kinase RsbT